MNLEITKQIYSVEIDSKKIILDSKTGKYFELNGVGSEIISFLQESPKPFNDLILYLTTKYRVKRETIESDVIKFIDKCVFIKKIL